jgi:hypothetical protein
MSVEENWLLTTLGKPIGRDKTVERVKNGAGEEREVVTNRSMRRSCGCGGQSIGASSKVWHLYPCAKHVDLHQP